MDAIDGSLDPVRAAIRMVADGSARRVTVYSPTLDRIVPAARQLARAAGVALETGDRHLQNGAGDLVVSARDTRPAA